MGFSRLRDRLEDDDPGVVSATVNVITELSRKSNPKNFLPLAPQLFELLTTSSNNWMLIKIVKLASTANGPTDLPHANLQVTVYTCSLRR